MLKIGICDDSSDYVEILSFKLNKVLKDMSIDAETETFSSLEGLKAFMSKSKLDVLFLDIMFDEKSSIDWCIENPEMQNLQVIFMTEYPAEAYNISEVNCSYFLVKSRTTDEILKKSVNKVIFNLSKKNPNTIIVKQGSTCHALDVNKIIYIEGMNNNIKLHISGGETLMLYETLKSFEKNLPHSFYRYHKSFIVNMNHIKKTVPHEFVLSNGDTIPIPPRKFNKIVEKYIDYINLF